jgi:hypothetical protein
MTLGVGWLVSTDTRPTPYRSVEQNDSSILKGIPMTDLALNRTWGHHRFPKNSMVGSISNIWRMKTYVLVLG